jgi:photosystem II stability/assembly factor-like uncharacterized protein
MRIRYWFAALVGFFAIVAPSLAEPIDARHYSGLRWRCIGPHRGGRTVGAAGIPGQPNVFFIGVNNGGVWKSTDYGRVWSPIFDDQPTGSIGTLAVAPSDPDVIYVGSGEGLQRPDLSVGDGVYKTIDGGKTWKHLGLRDGQQIPAIIVDPKNPDRVFVAVLGHPYGPNVERGIFRSLDGGATWEKVLFKDENTGGMALEFDPSNSQTIYAVLWAARQGPWENGEWRGPGSGLFKSTDGGATWKPLAQGLPSNEDGLGRIGIAISRSEPKRLFALVDAGRAGGLFRSDDAGQSWRRVSNEQRIIGRGSDFAEVKIDPKNPDRIYIANTGCYRSDDAGQSFACIRGAPGGDDYHTIWINPDNPDIILLATDQGAIVTVNGGETFSSWYNQPTAQFYHVITDNRFPYWVYGGQQESGSAGVASRGKDGQITFRDWHPVGVEEYGYVAPDPLDPDIIYGGKITRFDRRTGQVQNISPEATRSGKYRFLRTAPVIFSPVDPKALYYAGNVLFKTTTGGQSWDVISPDLSREKTEVPPSFMVSRNENVTRRGVIYTVAPSYKDAITIWCGTDDGSIHVTHDGGKNWTNVTPPNLTSWSKVSLIDAGRHDANTAYAAINRLRCDDLKPHILRTHDGGKTWIECVRGLPDDPVNTVREDPVRQGLLFCGTERMVHVSFNDGDDWQPLRQNMPCTSIRDLVVKDDDLVVGTHGRSFWILDDISPLRQLRKEVADSAAHLFAPQVATRVRWNLNTDTPLPPEEPAGQNPPDGAIFYYWLKTDSFEPITFEVLDSDQKPIYRLLSTDKPAEPPRTLAIRTDWSRPPQFLSAKAGMHRFVWDLHYPPIDPPRNYPIAAIRGDTAPEPHGPWVMPGKYTVKFTMGGKTLEQPLIVRMDPRVKLGEDALRQQYQISMECYRGQQQARHVQSMVQNVRRQIADRRGKADDDLKKDLAAFDEQLSALAGAAGGFGRRGAPAGREPSFGRVAGELGGILGTVQGADVEPTSQVIAAAKHAREELAKLAGRLHDIRANSFAPLNEKLRKAGLEELRLE